MANFNSVNSDDVRRIASMSDAELKQKLSALLQSSNGSALGKLLANINIESLKKQLTEKRPDDLAALVNKLGNLDPSFVNRLKDLIK